MTPLRTSLLAAIDRVEGVHKRTGFAELRYVLEDLGKLNVALNNRAIAIIVEEFIQQEIGFMGHPTAVRPGYECVPAAEWANKIANAVLGIENSGG